MEAGEQGQASDEKEDIHPDLPRAWVIIELDVFGYSRLTLWARAWFLVVIINKDGVRGGFQPIGRSSRSESLVSLG